MASYPIWNKVTACIYKGQKSYGVKQTGGGFGLCRIVRQKLASLSKPHNHNEGTHQRGIVNLDSMLMGFLLKGSCCRRVALTWSSSRMYQTTCRQARFYIEMTSISSMIQRCEPLDFFPVFFPSK